MVFHSSIHDITAEVSGIGMFLNSNETKYLGITRTSFWRLRATGNYYRGSGFYTLGIGTTDCNMSCFYSNRITFGTAFCIESNSNKQRITEISASCCPGYSTTTDTNGVIFFNKGSPEVEISKTNISHSHITQHGVYRWQHDNKASCTLSNAAGNVGHGVLCRYDASASVSVSEMNLVGNKKHSDSNSFIRLYNTSPFTLTDSICIENDYIKLSDISLDVSGCLFFECSFEASTLIPTTDKTPSTHAFDLFTDWMCLTNPISRTSVFTLSFRSEFLFFIPMNVIFFDD